jgi:hypothetical protein
MKTSTSLEKTISILDVTYFYRSSKISVLDVTYIYRSSKISVLDVTYFYRSSKISVLDVTYFYRSSKISGAGLSPTEIAFQKGFTEVHAILKKSGVA